MPEDAGVNALAPHVRVREMQTKRKYSEVRWRACWGAA